MGWKDTITTDKPDASAPSDADSSATTAAPASWRDTIQSTKAVADSAPESAAVAPTNPHDVKPFLKNAWQGVKDTANTFSTKPLPTIAYDSLVQPAVDAYNEARDSGAGVVNAGLDAASQGTGKLADLGAAAVAPGTVPLKAYLKSRSAGNSVEDALKDARNVGLLVAVPAVLGKVGGEMAPAVASAAENRAASAMGWTKALRNKFGADAASTAGRVGLNEGVITPLASTADKLERMEGVKQAAGQTIGNTMDSLDQAGVKEFSPFSTAGKINNEMGSVYQDEPLFSGLSDQYKNLLATVAKRGSQNISYADAQALKELLGRYGYKEGMAVPGKEQAQQAYGIVNKELDNAVNSGAQQLGDPDMLAQLQDARKNYGAAQQTLGGLENKQAGELGNQKFGLTDAIVAAPAIATNPARAAATVGLKKGLGAYGNNLAAVGADGLAKVLTTAPETFGAFAPVLAAAAQRGPDSLLATHKTLLKINPEYRKQLDSAE